MRCFRIVATSVLMSLVLCGVVISDTSNIKETYIQNILSNKIDVDDAIIMVDIDQTGNQDKYVNDDIAFDDKKSDPKNLTIKNISLLNWNLDKNHGRFRVVMEYNDASHEELTGRFFLYKDAYVASKNIKRNTIISDEDLKPIRVPYGKKVDIPNIYDIIGKQAIRNISSGSLISTNYLISPIAVKEKDIVEIIYKSSNIKLKTKGIAMKSGVVGDIIRVKNDYSGIIIQATIVDKGVVEIDNK